MLFKRMLISVRQRMRKNSSLFSGKQGFITLRELFRWAERYNKCTQEDGPADRDWDQIFANQGEPLDDDDDDYVVMMTITA